MSYKTYDMFMINTQYVITDIKDVFKLRMRMILHKYNVRSYNYT